MRKLALLITISFAALAASAAAQEEAAAGSTSEVPAAHAAAAPQTAAPAAARAPRLTVGADAAFQLPLGKFADLTGPGFGGLLRGEYNLISNLNATLRAGYLYTLKKDKSGMKTNLDAIPIWVGAKYSIMESFYVGAELGVNILKTTVEGTFNGVPVSGDSNRETKLGADVGVGVLFGDLGAHVQFQIMDLDYSADTMALILNLSYNFLRL